MDTLWLYAVLVFGIILLAGMVAGGFVHVFASGPGRALPVRSHAEVFNALLLADGIYVAWLGWQPWRGAGALAAVPAGVARPWHGSFARALLTCLMNPKAYLFCLAVLPQFLHPERGALLAQLAALFAIGALTSCWSMVRCKRAWPAARAPRSRSVVRSACC